MTTFPSLSYTHDDSSKIFFEQQVTKSDKFFSDVLITVVQPQRGKRGNANKAAGGFDCLSIALAVYNRGAHDEAMTAVRMPLPRGKEPSAAKTHNT